MKKRLGLRRFVWTRKLLQRKKKWRSKRSKNLRSKVCTLRRQKGKKKRLPQNGEQCLGWKKNSQVRANKMAKKAKSSNLSQWNRRKRRRTKINKLKSRHRLKKQIRKRSQMKRMTKMVKMSLRSRKLFNKRNKRRRQKKNNRKRPSRSYQISMIGKMTSKLLLMQLQQNLKIFKPLWKALMSRPILRMMKKSKKGKLSKRLIRRKLQTPKSSQSKSLKRWKEMLWMTLMKKVVKGNLNSCRKRRRGNY